MLVIQKVSWYVSHIKFGLPLYAGYFVMFSVTHIMLNDELDRIWKEVVMA